MVTNGKAQTAIVGVGATDYYPRGKSWPRTIEEMIGEAVLKACDDAGLSVKQIDGFAYYGSAKAGYVDTIETGLLMEMFGMPEITFTAALTGGGGGSAAGVGLATAAIKAGDAKHVVTVMALQQGRQRLGTVMASKAPTPELAFIQPAGLIGPGHMMATLARRHMHKFGTRREAFAEIAISTRLNAANRPKAVMKTPLTLDDYFSARMIADPLCLHDFCLETEGAIAVITTSAERARDLKQKPAYIKSTAHGARREWGRGFSWMGMPDDWFASSGHRSVAPHVFEKARLTVADIDVALIYDHFTPMVIMQLEDYGFCPIGEGGAFVESGAIRYHGGSIPVNTHGGQLSEGYIIGMTHLVEGVEQIRGTAINQVAGVEHALVTGGPASVPVSGLILGADA